MLITGIYSFITETVTSIKISDGRIENINRDMKCIGEGNEDTYKLLEKNCLEMESPEKN